MKNLKKILSLVLVLAMAFSFAAVASAKDYKEFPDLDQVSAEYLEAVNVVSAVNIFEGDDTGYLNPQGTFTRAQAAKIVAYLAAGKASADKIGQVGGAFDDVSAAHWASGYIAFAKQNGLLTGDGDGKFRPDASVSYQEFAKMALTALGYGKLNEYVGDSWSLRVQADAVAYRLIPAAVIDWTAPATREWVIGTTFRTIAPGLDAQNWLVAYNSTTGTYISKNDSTNASGVTGRTSYIGTEYFSLYYTGIVDAKDGSPNHRWRVGNVTLPELYLNDDDVITRTNGTTLLGARGLTVTSSPNYVASLGADVSYYINGSPSDLAAVEVVAAQNGTIVNLYLNGYGYVYHVAVIDKTVSKVLGVPTASNIPGVEKKTGFTTFDAANPAVVKDDIVLYYEDALNVVHIEKAEAVEGQLTKFVVNNNAPEASASTVGGVNYMQSELRNTIEDNDTLAKRIAIFQVSGNYNTNATIYLDNNGTIVYFDPNTVTNQYAYVIAMESRYGVPVSARMVLGDGTFISDAPVKIAADRTATATAAANNMGSVSAADDNQWYTYTVADGVYTLTSREIVAANAWDAQAITAAPAITSATSAGDRIDWLTNITGLTANVYKTSADTTFIFYDSAKNEVKTVANGITQIPQFAADASTTFAIVPTYENAALRDNTGVTPTAAYVFINMGNATITATSKLVFLANNTTAQTGGNFTSDNYIIDNVVKQGEAITADAFETVGLFSYVFDAAKNTYTLTPIGTVANEYEVGGGLVVKSGSRGLSIGGQALILADDAKIYQARPVAFSPNEVVVSNYEEIQPSRNLLQNTLLYWGVYDDNGYIKELYLAEDPHDANWYAFTAGLATSVASGANIASQIEDLITELAVATTSAASLTNNTAVIARLNAQVDTGVAPEVNLIPALWKTALATAAGFPANAASITVTAVTATAGGAGVATFAINYTYMGDAYTLTITGLELAA